MIKNILNVSLFIVIFYGCNTYREVSQPIAYNHAIHIEELEMECIDCHEGVNSKVRATLPSIDVCEACHSEMNGDSQAEALVVEAVENNTEIPWQRIYRVPDHVYFSHRRHVAVGNVRCEVCHGNVSKLATPPKRPLIPITMDFCVKCHAENQVKNDCLTCHR